MEKNLEQFRLATKARREQTIDRCIIIRDIRPMEAAIAKLEDAFDFYNLMVLKKESIVLKEGTLTAIFLRLNSDLHPYTSQVELARHIKNQESVILSQCKQIIGERSLDFRWFNQ